MVFVDISDFADGELLFFASSKKSNQKKGAPALPCLFATQHS
ncbi:hypothetical protein CF65_00240 [Aggregatibacter actinomycetemcomitans HK1651]|nr:hypothetical protein CF65_00240 [Aggregatibacter actinomycetemcomitans HK1651]